MSKILVTGATGHFGTATIKFLLNKGVPAANLAALVRNEAKAGDLRTRGVDIRIGNYNDISSLIEAFKGIEKVLFVSASDIAERTKQHENVLDALKSSDHRIIL